MTEQNNNQIDPHSAETLFHDIATPLLISKMKAGILANYLPQLMKQLIDSPDLHHLLPEDEKLIDALVSAPEIMVSNLEVVQKKINLLSMSVLHQSNIYGVRQSLGGDAARQQANNGNDSLASSLKTMEIKTVLLVDDEDIHRDIAANLLSPFYQMDYAENGMEAIRKCEQKRYDLILMDLHMPKMNGEQATIGLRSRIGSDTIIIGLTSLPLGANQSGLIAKGFTGFMEKPLTLKRLQDALKAYA
ncbi:response regulator [Cellvibrio sp. NN19]|uniref:response regulator n=1 Tax=Cellvibrio chitinivorans TaxID=3102792 RepID=UPI002B4114D4|nr:response regulator [Cellvibrio sp. NN19]